MQLFWRDHLALILFNTFQLILVLFIYWLDGYRNLYISLYVLSLAFFLLCIYLIYRYYSHRSFYQRLSNPLERLDDSIQKNGFAPLAEALDEVLESQYKHYQQQLKSWERKRKEHNTFMNQWVHQMKTPLSVIELIVQEEDDPRFLSIREEADRISKGLEMVLYVARLEVFEHDFQVENVSLYRLVDKSIHEHKRLFIRHHVYPEVLIEPTLTVESDAKWLRFVINQLLSNAIKYSAGSQAKVTLAAFEQRGKLVLEVRDKGIGIPTSDLKRVCQPFYTGDNGRFYRESTGMGLYLVHEICQRLNHQLEIESEVGQGTTVRLLFSSFGH